MKLNRLKLLSTITAALLLTACGGGGNGEEKQNSDHGLINNPPVAQAQAKSLKEDNSVSVTLIGTDEDNDALTYKIIKEPDFGKLKGKLPNVEYSPNKDYNGDDSFSYIANDGQEDSKEAVVDISVEPVNDKPIAKKDSINLNEDNQAVVNALENDIDVDQGDTLDIVSASNPAHGITKVKNGKVIYTPNLNYHGTDSFSYTIKDSSGATATAPILLDIASINDVPIAKEDNITTARNKAVTIDVLANDSDADNEPITIKSITQPNSGTAKIKNNKIAYIPNKIFFGKDKVEYTVTDSHGATDKGFIMIIVNEEPSIVSLELTLPNTEANKDTNITATIIAKYSDDTTKTLTDNIKWQIIPNDAIDGLNNVLITKKDTNATVQAKVINSLGEEILSNVSNLSIYWEVGGHRLPPMPDTVQNNKTLAGIDSNSNGVRDDVERLIYDKYDDKVQAAFMMYGAKVLQRAIEQPISEAKVIQKDFSKKTSCFLYLRNINNNIKEEGIESISFLENKTVNTKERVRKYLDYNIALSGGVYGSKFEDEVKASCSLGVIKALEEAGQ